MGPGPVSGREEILILRFFMLAPSLFFASSDASVLPFSHFPSVAEVVEEAIIRLDRLRSARFHLLCFMLWPLSRPKITSPVLTKKRYV